MKRKAGKVSKNKDKQKRQQKQHKQQKHQEQLELEKLLPTGLLVSYYLDGWRCGYVESVSATTGVVKIRPVPPYKVESVRCISVPLSDVKKIDRTNQKPKTSLRKEA